MNIKHAATTILCAPLIMAVPATHSCAYAADSTEVRPIGWYADLGIGLAIVPVRQPQADNPVGILRIGYRWEKLSIEYEHLSSVPDGPPVNAHIDDRWQERIAIYWRIYP